MIYTRIIFDTVHNNTLSNYYRTMSTFENQELRLARLYLDLAIQGLEMGRNYEMEGNDERAKECRMNASKHLILSEECFKRAEKKE